MKLVLGTVQFGMSYGVAHSENTVVSDEELFEILDYAYEQGIDTLDTAEDYGNAINRIAYYHSKRPFKFNIINKFKSDLLSSPNISTQVQIRRDELSIDAFDCVMLHGISEESDMNFKSLNSLIEAGVSRKLGASISKPKDIIFLRQMDALSVIQMPVNLLDTRFICATDSISGKEIHARSLFLQGLLLMNLDNVPDKLRAVLPFLSEIAKLANQLNVLPIVLCFMAVLRYRSIERLVIGSQNIEQLSQILEAYKLAEQLYPSIEVDWESFKCTDDFLLEPYQWLEHQ